MKSARRFIARLSALRISPFSSGIPRASALGGAIVFFCLISPETLGSGPDLCLWRHLFHLHACPGCGSTRALAALFHGHFAQALAFNRNVIATGPALMAMFARDLLRLCFFAVRGSLNSLPEANRLVN